MSNERPFLILAVLDGFGLRDESEWNAIAQAATPTFQRLFEEHPWVPLEASGLAVGLPDGQMGNSEVGHLNIGAGRVVDQDVIRISKAIDSHQIDQNPVLTEVFERSIRQNKAIHLVGLLSDGGVHSLQKHLHGLVDSAIRSGVAGEDGPSLFIHAILDGRDTPPRSANRYLKELVEFLEERPGASLSTVIGRYYTMDRDQRWGRTQRGYDLMTLGIGTQTSNPVASIERCYESGMTDEFMEPLAVLDETGAYRGHISDGDTVIFFNFRADRMRQIVRAFHDDELDSFKRAVRPGTHLVSMTSYQKDFGIPVVFEPVQIVDYLGEVLAEHGLKQLRIAETEKYAHVTFFFNGGSDEISRGEERVLVPSPKVATYDHQPEMSVEPLADRVVEEIGRGNYDVIVLNIANPDMVGHTGVMKAAIEAVAATDRAIARILEAVDQVDGVCLITADHGNCEQMFDFTTNQPHTAHTTSPVPFILYDPHRRFSLRSDGGALSNVAPTLLQILKLPIPAEMSASSLLEKVRDE